MKEIEIPFGAFDSELQGFEYTIPDGYTAEIVDGKIIVKKEESEDGKLSKKLHECVCMAINNDKLPYEERKHISEQVIPYLEKLEKQKEQKLTWSEEDIVAIDCAVDFLRKEELGSLAASLDRIKYLMTWKPTEEQLNSLLRVVADTIGFNARILSELYEDLKNL